MYLFWDYSGQSKVNTDGRIKRGGKTTNFYVHYEVDDDEVATALSLNEYGGDDESSWLLLEPVAAPVEAPS